MAFNYKGNINGGHNRTLVKVLLGASQLWIVGDPCAVSTADQVIPCSSGVRLFGLLTAIVTQGGVSPSTNGLGAAFVDRFTTASDNLTVAQISGLIDVDTNSLYSVNLDDTIGTTTGSNKRFYFFDVDTGTTYQRLNEASASQTNGQFFSLGLDQDNTNRVVVKIAESIMLKSDTN